MSRKGKFGIAFGLLLVLLLGAYGYARMLLEGAGPVSSTEGMVTTTFTDELVVDMPVALDITPDGRLFIVETGTMDVGVGDIRHQTFLMPNDLRNNSVADRKAQLEHHLASGDLTEGFFAAADIVRVIEDRDGDGIADYSEEFARFDGMMDGLIAGVLVDGADTYITEIPNVWKLTDVDGDNKADSRESLSYGYGLRTAFGGHDLHGLTWGPDGKLYFSLGDRGFNITNKEGQHLTPPMDYGRGAVFRMNPDGSNLEVFADGLRNPQELAFDNYGNLLTGDNNSDSGDKARILYVVEGADYGWSGPYQYMGEPVSLWEEAVEYIRGPYNAEKHWEPQHDNQPAWLLPPLANLTDGPAGMSHYPGTGFAPRYDGHFFLADYRYTGSRSAVWSFALAPAGAAFELTDVHKFLSGRLVTDQTFAYDGKMYLTTGAAMGSARGVEVAYHEEHVNDPEVLEVGRLFNEGFEQRNSAELQLLLSHADQRVRRKAQFTLAERGDYETLAQVLLDGEANQLARIHAVWGLGQMGAQALRHAGIQSLEFTGDDAELQAQSIKVAGEVGAQWLAQEIRQATWDSSPRVQFFAAQAIGKIGDQAGAEAVVDLLRRNNNQDVYLRQSGAYALSLLGADTALRFAQDDSAAVRLAVLLSLRKLQDPRVALYLSDANPALVVEAARAVYDLDIQSALPALAALAEQGELAYNNNDAQTSYALHRRVINANLRLGDEASALRLGGYVSNDRHPQAMRLEALDVLATFANPADIDRVIGSYRPLAPRSDEVVYKALDTYIPELLGSGLEEQALAVALAYNRVPLPDEDLLARVQDPSAALSSRRASLDALVQRAAGEKSAIVTQALSGAQVSKSPELRADALQYLAALDPSAALDTIAGLGDASVLERQRGFALLAALPGVQSDALLLSALQQIQAGELDTEVHLEVLTAAASRPEGPVANALKEYQSSLPADDLMAARHFALAGGDATNGKAVFDTGGDCLRCHSVNGRGGNAGPDLGGVAGKFSREYLLESMIDPNAALTEGFANIAVTMTDGSNRYGSLIEEDNDSLLLRVSTGHGEPVDQRITLSDIASRTSPASGMPPMGLVVSDSDLRDLVAYLATLQ